MTDEERKAEERKELIKAARVYLDRLEDLREVVSILHVMLEAQRSRQGIEID